MRNPILVKAVYLWLMGLLFFVAGSVISVEANNDIDTKQTVSSSSEILVTTTLDEINNDGDCSLREAIQAANTDTSVDACLAGNGDDNIILSAGIYTLSQGGNSEDANAEGDLDVTGVLTIAGDGAATTIIQAGTNSTNGIDRVLHVLASSTLTVKDVQIRYGQANSGATPHIDGGGIYVAENGFLNVDNCIVSQNWGANGGGITTAIYTTINIYNSHFLNNYSHSVGGGIKIYGLANIYNSTFDENIGIFGGGIGVSDGTVYISSSTLSNNEAIEWEDGPPGDGGAGGAISNLGELYISNSTISGNAAINVGGGIHNLNKMHISNCSLVENEAPDGGGAINVGGLISITNSIIADNVGENCSGGIISRDFNIGSDDTCDLIKTNDQFNTNPKLDVLADNGGLTWTHALLFDSPAIDSGDCSDGTLTEDQRGKSRPQGDGCDIGAYEYVATIDLFLPLVSKE